jgi:hypothetical protein
VVGGGGCAGGYFGVFVYMIYREAANVRGLWSLGVFMYMIYREAAYVCGVLGSAFDE